MYMYMYMYYVLVLAILLPPCHGHFDYAIHQYINLSIRFVSDVVS